MGAFLSWWWPYRPSRLVCPAQRLSSGDENGGAGGLPASKWWAPDGSDGANRGRRYISGRPTGLDGRPGAGLEALWHGCWAWV